MNRLSAGFARTDVTPMLGIPINGYYKERFMEGVLDPLEINALALSCADQKALILNMDNCGIVSTARVDEFRYYVEEVTGVPYENIYLSFTHSHTAGALDTVDPTANWVSDYTKIDQYSAFVKEKFALAAKMALDDLKPARMGFGTGKAENIAFIRRFRMKDGSVRTNPGVNNPDILSPIGDIDDTVKVMRFDRENADTIVFVSFACHPDVVGGNQVSADWPGFLRRRVELALPGTKCIFLNGCEGDINHVNVHPKGGDFNDMFDDFDGVSRGYGHARHMGNVVAAGVLQIFDKVEYRDVESIAATQATVEIPSNMPVPEDMPEAYHIEEFHAAGRDDDLPYKGMDLTTKVAEAERMIRLEHGPESFPLYLTALRIGDVCLAGIPGEPFNGVSVGLRAYEGYDLIIPTCITNGYEGYFPMKDSYDEGGYEAATSIFKAGVAELIVQEGIRLMDSIR